MEHRGRKNVYDRMGMEESGYDRLAREQAAKARQVDAPAPPAHLSAQMQAWWHTVTVAYDFEPHHYLLLEAAGNAWDAMEAARLEIAREGPSYLNKEGEPRPRPECAVLRDSRAAFARIVKDLGLDAAPAPTPSNFGSWTPPWKP